jgi:hypothetical protein
VPTLRQTIESASLPFLQRLGAVPRAVPFLLVLGLMVAGILVPGWGWLFLLPVLVFLVWTLYLGWPALDGGARLGRVAVVLMAVAITVTQALPRS